MVKTCLLKSPPHLVIGLLPLGHTQVVSKLALRCVKVSSKVTTVPFGPTHRMIGKHRKKGSGRKGSQESSAIDDFQGLG